MNVRCHLNFLLLKPVCRHVAMVIICLPVEKCSKILKVDGRNNDAKTEVVD